MDRAGTHASVLAAGPQVFVADMNQKRGLLQWARIAYLRLVVLVPWQHQNGKKWLTSVESHDPCVLILSTWLVNTRP